VHRLGLVASTPSTLLLSGSYDSGSSYLYILDSVAEAKSDTQCARLETLWAYEL
jgi:hypothetical protein